MTEASIKIKKYTYFIGIDVSRNKLDYAVMRGNELLFHREAENEPQAIITFVAELKLLPKFTISKTIFCLENTGFYCNHLLTSLKKLKANIAQENALQIKNSMGLIRGKYDKIDAIRIAQYALKNTNDLRFWVPRRPIMEQLNSLNTLRTRMLTLQMSLKNPLKEQKTFIKKGLQKQSVQLCKGSAAAIKLDLEEIESEIDLLIDRDENLGQRFKQIMSVPCVGRVTAIQVLISTNEFLDITEPKKFACYSGVAPFKKESGLFKGKAKVSPIANKRIKSLLHICALNAIRHDEELRIYYERKTKGEGKPKMAVINAVRYKLILRIFACLKQNRLFEKEYQAVEVLEQVS